jgi:hypothetical protein
MGRYDLQAEGAERLGVLEEMYRLAHYWGFEDSDLFKGLTGKLIESIDTRTHENCESCQPHLSWILRLTMYVICVVRKLAGDLHLEDGPLGKKCEEFERINSRSVLAESH